MAAKPLTKCPECSSKITNRFECRNCGLLFDRYFKAQSRKRKEEKVKAAKKAKTVQILSSSLTFAALVIFLGVGYYYLGTKKQESATGSDTATVNEQTKQAETTRRAPAQRQQSAPAAQSGDSLSIVFNAIAIINTPWGNGTGFFIEEDKLVTNKHIALYDEERLEKEIQKLSDYQIRIDETNAKIEKLKERAQTATDNEKKQEYEAKIKKREDRLARMISKQQKQEQQLTRMKEEIEAPNISVTLADGREVYMAFLETSSNYDLALLTVFSTGITGAKTADTPLNKGDSVYSLGKNKKSFKGSFRGYSEEGYIMTDASINPSYSGGPLTDKKGMVHGVSILPPQDQKGVWLAIPIATVKQEFGL